MSSESIFPFLPNNAGSPPQLFPYDVVINEAYPGIQFMPTEPNGEYQEIREVSGALWLVTNAQWNANLLQWDQEANQNTGLPAFALQLSVSGAMIRYYSPPTNIPNTPITWIPLFDVDQNGLVAFTPKEVFNPSPPMETLTAIWDPGVGIALVAREVDITNIASNSGSRLDKLVVNGTEVWAVDVSGTLVAGTIPVARITGLPPPFVPNNVTFTGTSTFNGPAVFNGTVTENAPVTDNSTLDVFGAATMHSTLDTFGPTNINSTLGVTNTSTFTGHATFNGGLTSNVSLIGPNGIPVGNFPDETSGTFVIPPVGGSVVVPIFSSTGFPPSSKILIWNNVNAMQATVTSNNGSPQTSLTVTNAGVLTGSVGNTMASGSIVTPTSFIRAESSDGSVSLTNAGTTFDPVLNIEVAPNRIAVGGVLTTASASTTGSGGDAGLTFSLLLTGPASFTYDIVIEVTSGTGGASSMDLTVTGGSFPGTPQTWSVGNFSQYVHAFAAGSGVGGDTISAVLSNFSGMSAKTQFWRMQAIRTA